MIRIEQLQSISAYRLLQVKCSKCNIIGFLPLPFREACRLDLEFHGLCSGLERPLWPRKEGKRLRECTWVLHTMLVCLYASHCRVDAVTDECYGINYGAN